jgi:NAD(P)H dehydrogenase (quinone)
MWNLVTDAPITDRRQNLGGYRIPEMVLRDGLEAPGDVGFALHVRKD